MAKQHDFPARVVWTGNKGTGTSAYKAYERTWDMALPDKEIVHCSNDPMLGGDPTKYNPEDLLIGAVSACHMLWYLHLCSQAGITVTEYVDDPVGVGESEPSGKGRFIEAVLNPQITITPDSDKDKAISIHDEIHNYCFIARSVNFPIRYDVEIKVASS